MARPNGYVIYRGPSCIDGSPIVCIGVNFARPSKNAKTGKMVATYILADDGESPIEAVKSGKDSTVCGDCPHRGQSCYVNVAQAPTAIYKAYKRGVYPMFNPPSHLHLLEDKLLRMGSYGDPAAVPFMVWATLCGASKAHTGYSHQWDNDGTDPRLKRLCMASCDTAGQRERAVAKGWRTFRVMRKGEKPGKGEFVCPASAESDLDMTCSTCKACDGNRDGRGASPAIVWHGPNNPAGDWKYQGFVDLTQRLEIRERVAPRRMELTMVPTW